MQTEIKNNIEELVSPPVPPAAVFDDQHMAAAKPVEPLPQGPWRKSADALQRIFGRHVIAIAIVITVIVIGVAGATATIDWPSQSQPANDDPVQAMSESPPEPTVRQLSTGGTVRRRDHKRRSLSNLPDVEPVPRLEFDEGDNDRTRRPRLVTVIH